MALKQTELNQLADLLRRVNNRQMRGAVWHALVTKVPTVPIELIVLDDQNRVLLVYRDDAEFKGWHHPGSVWNDWETIPERRQKLIEGEVINGIGIQITEPVSIGWMGVYRGNGPDNSFTRNACALMHTAYLIGEFTSSEKYRFFSFDEIPDDTLSHHKFMLRRVAEYLKTGVILKD
jgi:rhodanese-related sulfurtransferase